MQALSHPTSSSFFLTKSNSSAFIFPPSFFTPPTGYNHPKIESNSNAVNRPVTARWVPSAKKPAAAAAAVVTTSPYPEPVPGDCDSAADVVRKFYDGINGRDLASVQPLIAEDCVYEDLIFPQPFVGRKAILEFFKKFIDSISFDLQFAIDDISEEDSSAVGVTWHLEWKGKAFPFSKGCSFYRLKVINDRTQITYGRDSVEPAIKPGETALVAIRGVTWLLQQFPQLADRL